MYKIFTLILSICFISNLKGQEFSRNMELLSNLQYPTTLSDIWGYVSPDGREYAIVGTLLTTSIVDLSDPRNPIEVAEIPGASSTLRDMKQFGEYVYVTTDRGADGLLIINMANAPNEITSEFWQPEIEVNGDTSTLQTCHNIFIDEDGYAYLSGCNTNSGVLILDIFSNPGEPQFVSITHDRRSHDVMVQDNLLYSSDIRDGIFTVFDVFDKSNPVELATQSTSFQFTHNAWVSTDNNYLFTTDERGNAFVDSYDISNLADITMLDRFRPEAPENEGSIPHNTHYLNGYLVTSWYTDGVRIIDGNRPQNLVEIAYFDTFPQNSTGFSGVWGVSPFLPSGIVIASDINTGLYVFDVDYVRAAYLEGNISDSETGLPLDNVTIVIEGGQLNNSISNAIGEYKTGQAEAGEYTVTFERSGYFPNTSTATLVNGELTILDIELVPNSIVSTSNLVENNILTAGPNPFRGNVFLNFEEEVTGTLTVTNVLGQFVESIILENARQIEIGAQYNAGTYFISLAVDNEQYKAIRIVKQ